MVQKGDVWGMTRLARQKGAPKLTAKGAALPQQMVLANFNGLPFNHACYSFICVGRCPKAVYTHIIDSLSLVPITYHGPASADAMRRMRWQYLDPPQTSDSQTSDKVMRSDVWHARAYNAR